MREYARTLTDDQLRAVYEDEQDRAWRYKGTDREEETREDFLAVKAEMIERGLLGDEVFAKRLNSISGKLQGDAMDEKICVVCQKAVTAAYVLQFDRYYHIECFLSLKPDEEPTPLSEALVEILKAHGYTEGQAHKTEPEE